MICYEKSSLNDDTPTPGGIMILHQPKPMPLQGGPFKVIVKAYSPVQYG